MRIPGRYRLSQWLQSMLPQPSRDQVFAEIYAENRWASMETRSGPGSSLEATAPLREALGPWLRTHAICSVLDVPCGDFHWMQHVDLTGIDYTGADLVPELIAKNNACFGTATRRFACLDLVKDPLPHAELVIVRDALVHLPLRDVQRALENIRASGCRLAAITHFPMHAPNTDIRTGAWRPLNLCAAPLAWPQPDDTLPDVRYAHASATMTKVLGVWKIN